MTKKEAQKDMEEILKLAQKLIRFRSTMDRTRELRRIVDYCARYFQSTGFYIRRFEKNGVPSLVVTTKRTKRPKVLLAGHLDVVSAEDEDFIPRLTKSRLYGRGAADMKANCALMMHAVKKRAKKLSYTPLGLLLTTDEEISGVNGTKYVVYDKGYSADVVLLPDGGHNFSVVTAQKGAIWFKYTAIGTAAHGSRPWLGSSAIKQFMKAFRDLRRMIPDSENGDENGNGWKPTIVLSSISSIGAHNRVPNRCEGMFDLRFTSDKSIRYWRKIVMDIARKYDLKCDIFGEFESSKMNPNNPYTKLFRKIGKDVLGREFPLLKEDGGSDAKFFTNKGMPVIISTPNGGNIHSDNEWMDLKSLEKYYVIVERFLAETL